MCLWVWVSERGCVVCTPYGMYTLPKAVCLTRPPTLHHTQGIVASYVHNAAGPLMGQAGALVGIKTDATGDKLAQVGAGGFGGLDGVGVYVYTMSRNVVVGVGGECFRAE